jgi:hypothetical protein
MFGNLYMDGNPTNDLFYRNSTLTYPGIQNGDWLLRTQSDATYMQTTFGEKCAAQPVAVAFMQSWLATAQDKCAIPMRPNSTEPSTPPAANRYLGYRVRSI